MALELDYRTIARLPDTIEFARSGRSIKARRTQLGEVCVADRSLWIADVMYEGTESKKQPRLPVRPPNGSHAALEGPMNNFHYLGVDHSQRSLGTME